MHFSNTIICNHNVASEFAFQDPHYYTTDEEPDLPYLWKEGWLKWCNTEDLSETDFYNMCMPMAAYK